MAKPFKLCKNRWTISNDHPGSCVHLTHTYIEDEKLTNRVSIRLEENMKEELEDLHELLTHVLNKTH